jgi:hypothetical protein
LRRNKTQPQEKIHMRSRKHKSVKIYGEAW